MINLGNHTLADALHDKICLLYMLLESGGSAAQVITWVNEKHGIDVPKYNDREYLHRLLADAMWNYENITGREDHPMNDYFDSIAV